MIVQVSKTTVEEWGVLNTACSGRVVQVSKTVARRTQVQVSKTVDLSKLSRGLLDKGPSFCINLLMLCPRHVCTNVCIKSSVIILCVANKRVV